MNRKRLALAKDVDPACVTTCPFCKTVRPTTKKDCPLCRRDPQFKVGHASANSCELGVDLCVIEGDGIHMLSLSWDDVRDLVLKKGRRIKGLNPESLLEAINK